MKDTWELIREEHPVCSGSKEVRFSVCDTQILFSPKACDEESVGDLSESLRPFK